jgi:hypothetical protein
MLDGRGRPQLTAAMDTGDADRFDDRPHSDLAGSARGWHRLQLGVLAFIGLCGVLSDVDPAAPRWLQVAAMVLAFLALALACVATFLVATVAWPFPTAAPGGSVAEGPAADPAATRRLRLGVVLTYAAVGVMALAASTNWWPSNDDAGGDAAGGAVSNVTIADSSGRTACGSIVEAPPGWTLLATAAGRVEVRLAGLTAITPVAGC